MSKNKKMEIIAPLAIDFGAANSGVVSYTYSSGNLLNEPDTVKKGYLFKVGDIQFSQRNRLARRHQRRGIKRRQMARRLIFLILKDYFKIDEIKPETAVFIQSLIRRRGFTYLTEELDESVIKNADPEFLYAEFPEIFSKKSGESVLEQLLNVASDADKLTKALNDQWIQADKKTLEKHIKEKYPDADKDLINTYKELHGQIKNYTEKVYKAVKEGHKTRKEYFKSIRADIENNWKTLKELHTEKPHKLTADGFANLIGNISNLQLRVIRKYFNTPVDPKTGKPVESPDVFYPEKLGIKIRKWVRSWHIDKKADEIKIQKEVYLSLKGKEKNIIEILMSMDPDKTIPPYEDMNNRRIPACQSMILDPINLNKHYPDWREWTKALAAEFEREWVAECSIENFGIHYNSEIRIADQKKNGKVKLKKKEWEDEKTQNQDAVILQRMLDASVFLDPFRLRWQANAETRNLTKKEKKELNDARALTEKVLGDGCSGFMELLKDYYEQIREVRKGLKLSSDTELLKQCGHKAKKKSNITEILIKGVLQASEFTREDLNRFEEKVWKEKFHGSASLRSFCAKAEALRDSDGILFAQTVKRVAFKLKRAADTAEPATVAKKKRSSLTLPEDLDDHEREVAKALQQLPLATKAIAGFFPGLTEAVAQRRGKAADALQPSDYPFGNLFSMAQIYNILEKEQGGYTKTCPACTADNNWRGTIVRHTKNEKTGAVASRLTGDTVRPFDGVVRRLCDRLAIEIAAKKVKELLNEPLTADRNTALRIPILIEQNQFDFHSDLGKVKKEFGITNSKTEKKAQERKERISRQESGKITRIKEASQNISPLSGKAIGDGGEIDHIIPRSKSRDIASTVYNSEMNLIYMGQSDNQKKGNREIHLSDLHPNYLKAQFGTADINTIKNQISERLDKITQGRRKVFHSYEQADQRALRHSLFDQELRTRAMEFLNTATMAMANGTQKYFARRLQDELKTRLEREEYKNFEYPFPLRFASASETQSDRKELAKHYDEFKKEDIQSAGSHIVDATMVLSSIARQESGIAALQSTVDLKETVPLADSLKELLPDSFEIITIDKKKKYRKKNLGSVSIFKEGLYGERIVPLFVNQGMLGVGFTPENGLTVGEHQESFFEVIRPYLFDPEKSLDSYITEANNGFLRIPFVRARVIHTLFTMIKENNTENDVFRILQGLRYTVKKEKIQSRFEDQQKKPKSADDVLDIRKFNIKIDVPRLECIGRILKSLVPLTFPAIADWERLTKDPLIKRRISKNEKYNDDDWEEIAARNFPRAEKIRKHSKVRKVFSLPVIENPSGGFRFRRKTFTGGNVYQVAAVDDGAFAGFPGIHENVNLSKDAALLLTRQ